MGRDLRSGPAARSDGRGLWGRASVPTGQGDCDLECESPVEEVGGVGWLACKVSGN